ncbi:MAG: hypothetical protein AB7U25_09425 [Vicinamibacterales bacterium]
MRFCRVAAWVALGGAVVSGPLAVWLVQMLRPQPPWRDAQTFAAAYHPLQTVPYVAGFALVGGLVALVAGLHALAPPPLRARTTAATASAAAFAALIVANYALQTTMVPALVAAAEPPAVALAGWITMVNPQGLGWALEMWGYAVLGGATWLVAPVFAGGDVVATWTRRLFAANGPFSIVGGVATAAWPGWVLSTPGLMAFALWNVLVVAMLALAATSLGRTGDAARHGSS